jgi:hypothetical protein
MSRLLGERKPTLPAGQPPRTGPQTLVPGPVQLAQPQQAGPSAGMHMRPCVHGHEWKTYHDTTLKQNRAPTDPNPLGGRRGLLAPHCSYMHNTPPPPFNPGPTPPRPEPSLPSRQRCSIDAAIATPMFHRCCWAAGPGRRNGETSGADVIGVASGAGTMSSAGCTQAVRPK